MAARSEPDQPLRVVDPSAVPRTAEGYREWWEENTGVPYGYCWCECGQRTRVYTYNDKKEGAVRGEPKRLLIGHALRLLHNALTVEEFREWWAKNTDVPYGYCWCGCGQKTSIVKVTQASKHYFEGEPYRYLVGHVRRPDPSEIEAYKREWLEKRPGIPYGYCWCGCGQKTSIATKTRTKLKWFKGEPKRWVRGHQNAVRPVSGS